MPVPGIISAGPSRLYESANCVLMLAAKDSIFIIFFISWLCCVHLLVWVIVRICVESSTFSFHESLQSSTFLIRLGIALGMCSIRACSFQIAFGGFWACDFLGCIGKFVTCFSSPGRLSSSLGVVDRFVLCFFFHHQNSNALAPHSERMV